jgi:hypothetical protein
MFRLANFIDHLQQTEDPVVPGVPAPRRRLCFPAGGISLLWQLPVKALHDFHHVVLVKASHGGGTVHLIETGKFVRRYARAYSSRV